MKISRKGRYALRSLVYLAMNVEKEKVTLNNIAEMNGISVKYLEYIFSGLRRAGIVKSIHGIRGGYFLNNEPGRITVQDVLQAVEGDYRIPDEEPAEDCLYKGISNTVQRRVIDEINRQTGEIISHTTLKDLVDDYESSERAADNVYYI